MSTTFPDLPKSKVWKREMKATVAELTATVEALSKRLEALEKPIVTAAKPKRVLSAGMLEWQAFASRVRDTLLVANAKFKMASEHAQFCSSLKKSEPVLEAWQDGQILEAREAWVTPEKAEKPEKVKKAEKTEKTEKTEKVKKIGRPKKVIVAVAAAAEEIDEITMDGNAYYLLKKSKVILNSDFEYVGIYKNDTIDTTVPEPAYVKRILATLL